MLSMGMVLGAPHTSTLAVMNSAVPLQLNYDHELLEAAAKCYVRRYFRGKGRWLLAACVVNALGFVAALALGAKFDLVMAWGAEWASWRRAIRSF